MSMKRKSGAFAIVLAFAVIGIAAMSEEFFRNIEVYDPDMMGINWYTTGWHLDDLGEGNYTTEFQYSKYHGWVNDSKGDQIYSVSCVQGYFPHGWPIPGWEASHKGRNRLRHESVPKRLVVKFKVVSWAWNMGGNQSYANYTWVTLGIDIRGSVLGKSYNESVEMDGQSWVFCANLFCVKNVSGSIIYSKPGEILLACYDLDYGSGTESCYHYSVATLDSEAIKMDTWYTVELNLKPYIRDMETYFEESDLAVHAVHLVQPFAETSGGYIEVEVDRVEFSN